MIERFAHILQGVRDGVVLPDHFVDDDQDDEDDERGQEYKRWWEDPTDPDYERFHRTYSQKGK